MADPTQWEYLVHTIKGGLTAPKDDVVETTLDEWGQQGWEVIGAFQPSGSNSLRFIAKRPLSTRARRTRSLPG